MAKSSRPDRKRNERRPREPSEFEEVTLSVDRVTRVVKGGRRMRFRAVVVIGNKKGKVGLGTGKATEVQAAVRKAASDARRNMIRIPLVEGTIPHEIDAKFKASRIRLLPARPGTGIIAGSALRVVLENAGVRDVLSKRFGTNSKLVNAQCVMRALQTLRWPKNLPKDDAPPSAPDVEPEEKTAAEKSVIEVSRSQIDAEGNLTEKK